MHRRAFLNIAAGGLLATPLAAGAQQPGKIPRVGLLFFGPTPSREERTGTNPFWLGMKELGWIEGQNLIVERRGGESADQLRAAAADLVRLKADLLIVLGLGLAGFAWLETKTNPIVIQNAGGDLVAAGLVAVQRNDGPQRNFFGMRYTNAQYPVCSREGIIRG